MYKTGNLNLNQSSPRLEIIYHKLDIVFTPSQRQRRAHLVGRCISQEEIANVYRS